MEFAPIQFRDNKLLLLDQTKLPGQEVFLECYTLDDVYHAIKNMVVRGAPCIGFTAIFGMALWIKDNCDFSLDQLKSAGSYIKSARPTAVNLAFEVDQVIEILERDRDRAFERTLSLGKEKIKQSEASNRKMAEFAEQDLNASLGQPTYNILTHCNTGFLACGSVGTALGVVQHLFEKEKLRHCWVDETRPYLQGARLTAYELVKLGVPHDIVVEGAASFLMKTGRVDAIFTGADRIVANGDTANKIGTSNLAIIAHYYGIPFYIVAPSSTFDLSIENGNQIDIELRPEAEILEYREHRIAPAESGAFNPSFDITEGKFITGIISEYGIIKENYKENLPRIVK